MLRYPGSLTFLHKEPVDETKSMIYGKIGNDYFGYSKIIEICK